jgi:hypothetical protein
LIHLKQKTSHLYLSLTAVFCFQILLNACFRTTI